MINCPKCGQEMPDETRKCPNCAYELPAEEEAAPQRRAVPNIPRREPDSLPERPERSGSSGRSGTLIMLIHLGMMPAWIVIVILCRELAVDGLRMVAVTKGNVIAAGPLGKWKTACQMILISAMLILNLSVYECWPLAVLAGIVVLLTLGSAVDYFVRNASVLSEK